MLLGQKGYLILAKGQTCSISSAVHCLSNGQNEHIVFPRIVSPFPFAQSIRGRGLIQHISAVLKQSYIALSFTSTRGNTVFNFQKITLMLFLVNVASSLHETFDLGLHFLAAIGWNIQRGFRCLCMYDRDV